MIKLETTRPSYGFTSLAQYERDTVETKNLTSRPVCIELRMDETPVIKAEIGTYDSGHSNIDVVLPMETVCQRLCNAFSFIIASARADWVDMAPAAGYQTKLEPLSGITH